MGDDRSDLLEGMSERQRDLIADIHPDLDLHGGVRSEVSVFEVADSESFLRTTVSESGTDSDDVSLRIRADQSLITISMSPDQAREVADDLKRSADRAENN